MNPTSLVFLKQYLDCKSKLDGKIRESHEYIKFINPCIKNYQQSLQCAPHPYIVIVQD